MEYIIIKKSSTYYTFFFLDPNILLLGAD